MNGNYLALYVKGQRIALAKSNDLTSKTAMIDITTQDSAGNKEIMPGLKENTCSMEGICTSNLTNLLQWPENIENSAWFTQGANVSGLRAEAPNGQMRAQVITWNNSISIGQNTGASLPLNSQITASIYVKGTGSVKIGCGDENDSFISNTITLSSNWQRIEITAVIESGNQPYLILAKVSGTAVTVAYPQLEVGQAATLYKGSQTTLEDLQTIADNREKITVLYTDSFEGSMAQSFEGYISDVQIKSSANDASTFTCNFESTTAKTISTI